MTSRKRFWAILLCVCLMFTLAACTPKPAEPQGNTDPSQGTQGNEQQPTTGPQTGGKLTVAVSNLFADYGYAPRISNNAALMQAWAAYESLLTTDANGNDVPLLATKWESNPSEPSITFYLREGVKFSDGEPFNAAAVQRNMEEYASINRSELANIESYEIINDYTIKLHQKAWSSADLHTIGFYVLFTSPKALQNVDSIKDRSAGTGPFMIKSFESGVRIVYEKNPNYWQEGKPYLDELEFVLIADASAMSSAFRAKDIEAAFATTFVAGDTISSGCAAQIRSGEVVSEKNSNGLVAVGRGLIFDSSNSNSPFSDARVRRAVAWGLDEELLNNAIFQGQQMWTDQFALPGQASYNDSMKKVGYDVEKAKALLAEAGYPNGFNTVITGAPSDQTMITAVANSLKEIGINAEVTVVDTATFNSVLVSGVFDGIYVFPYTMGDMAFYMNKVFSATPTSFKAAIPNTPVLIDQVKKLFAAGSDADKVKVEKEMEEMLFGEDGYFFWDPMTVMSPTFFKISALHDDQALQTSQWKAVWADAWLEQ